MSVPVQLGPTVVYLIFVISVFRDVFRQLSNQQDLILNYIIVVVWLSSVFNKVYIAFSYEERTHNLGS